MLYRFISNIQPIKSSNNINSEHSEHHLGNFNFVARWACSPPEISQPRGREISALHSSAISLYPSTPPDKAACIHTTISPPSFSISKDLLRAAMVARAEASSPSFYIRSRRWGAYRSLSPSPPPFRRDPPTRTLPFPRRGSFHLAFRPASSPSSSSSRMTTGTPNCTKNSGIALYPAAGSCSVYVHSRS